mmetsp:Transcript_31747/g.91450  ORF Transcript_31747/g.91450 Transcript_31747/m.91450 type:complete len:261 (+) Transcript_31747:124-906(+)
MALLRGFLMPVRRKNFATAFLMELPREGVWIIVSLSMGCCFISKPLIWRKSSGFMTLCIRSVSRSGPKAFNSSTKFSAYCFKDIHSQECICTQLPNTSPLMETIWDSVTAWASPKCNQIVHNAASQIHSPSPTLSPSDCLPSPPSSKRPMLYCTMPLLVTKLSARACSPHKKTASPLAKHTSHTALLKMRVCMFWLPKSGCTFRWQERVSLRNSSRNGSESNVRRKTSLVCTCCFCFWYMYSAYRCTLCATDRETPQSRR